MSIHACYYTVVSNFIHSTYSYLTSFRSFLILSSHSYLIFLNVITPLRCVTTFLRTCSNIIPIVSDISLILILPPGSWFVRGNNYKFPLRFNCFRQMGLLYSSWKQYDAPFYYRAQTLSVLLQKLNKEQVSNVLCVRKVCFKSIYNWRAVATMLCTRMKRMLRRSYNWSCIYSL